MGAKLIRACLLATTVVFAGVASAGSVNGDSTPDQGARALVSQRLAFAVAGLGERMEVCDAREGVLDEGILDGVSLSRKETLMVLRYFHFKARNECLEDAAKEYLMAVYLLRESGLEEDVKAAMNSKVDMASALMFPYWDELKFEARYQMLPAAKREQIESISALQRPFDLIATAENWGLLRH